MRIDASIVADRLGKSLDDVWSAFGAEVVSQASACRIEERAVGEPIDLPEPLAEALVRRVARNLAMRNIPLGVVMDEAGGTRIGWSDPEIRRLEGPYRRVPVG